MGARKSETSAEKRTEHDLALVALLEAADRFFALADVHVALVTARLDAFAKQELVHQVESRRERRDDDDLVCARIRHCQSAPRFEAETKMRTGRILRKHAVEFVVSPENLGTRPLLQVNASGGYSLRVTGTSDSTHITPSEGRLDLALVVRLLFALVRTLVLLHATRCRFLLRLTFVLVALDDRSVLHPRHFLLLLRRLAVVAVVIFLVIVNDEAVEALRVVIIVADIGFEVRGRANLLVRRLERFEAVDLGRCAVSLRWYIRTAKRWDSLPRAKLVCGT